MVATSPVFGRQNAPTRGFGPPGETVRVAPMALSQSLVFFLLDQITSDIPLSGISGVLGDNLVVWAVANASRRETSGSDDAPCIQRSRHTSNLASSSERGSIA